MGAVGTAFSFTENELLNMPIDRLLFWNSQAKKVYERSQS